MGSGIKKGNNVSSWAARRDPEAARAHALDMKMKRYRTQNLPGMGREIWAIQIFHPFTVDVFDGKKQKGEAGDHYCMDDEGNQWVTPASIFSKAWYRDDAQ